MIEVQVPKDITGYEPPLVGPLTARQTVCVVAAAAIEYCYYMVLKMLDISITAGSDSVPLLIGIALIVPILYIAIGKPYGMRAEVYIYYYLLPSLVAPKDRPYVAKLTYDTILEEIDKQEEAEELQKTGKKKTKQPEKKQKKVPKSKGRDTIYA